MNKGNGISGDGYHCFLFHIPEEEAVYVRQ